MKIIGKVIFTCEDRKLIQEDAKRTKQTEFGVALVATSIGVDEQGDQVAAFRFTWLMKAKGKRHS